MSHSRKSFLIHIDSLEILDDLTDEQAGQLFKKIKAHQKNEEMEVQPLIKIAFSPFKNQFQRDDEKYEKTVERNRNNGLKGGRPKTQPNPEEPKEPTGFSGNQTEPKKADSKNDSDSDSDSKKDSDNKEISSSANADSISILTYFNEVCKTKYKHTTKSHIENINARLRDHSVDDLKLVVDFKFKEWGSDQRMVSYLRPQTLFSAGKFEGYLMAAKSKTTSKQGVNYVGNDFRAPEGWQ